MKKKSPFCQAYVRISHCLWQRDKSGLSRGHCVSSWVTTHDIAPYSTAQFNYDAQGDHSVFPSTERINWKHDLKEVQPWLSQWPLKLKTLVQDQWQLLVTQGKTLYSIVLWRTIASSLGQAFIEICCFHTFNKMALFIIIIYVNIISFIVDVYQMYVFPGNGRFSGSLNIFIHFFKAMQSIMITLKRTLFYFTSFTYSGIILFKQSQQCIIVLLCLS